MTTKRPFSVPVLEELVIRQLPVPAHPATTFNEQHLLALLARSVSLEPEEKVGFLKQVPTFSQKQIDALFRILMEEQEKLAALEARLDERLRRASENQDAQERRRAFRVVRGERP